MGRPPRHDMDRLLDAAAALAAAGGPAAVTVTAVAREAGAPSGSIYHRFPSRAALLAELWLRTVERFQEGFLDALDGDSPAAAARHVVSWCRVHPAEAAVLLYGPVDFGEPTWPTDARDRLAKRNAQVDRTLRALADRLGRSGAEDVDRLVLATVDIPYSTVRRHLRGGSGIPEYAEDLVADCAGRLLTR
ncbi:TetR/AcrR family transcriptional regulator [Saccharothrix sp. AJ9571]|nr:TetR/AcrR family transcriptional regulator [Saccharothrix sp. AJ9571]